MMRAQTIRGDDQVLPLVSLAAAVSFLLIGLLPLARPGLCPCWMFADPQAFHPHPYGHAEVPHDHGYLFDMSPSVPAQPPPPLLSPQEIVERLRAQGDLWSRSGVAVVGGVEWSTPPATPPPRPPA